MIQLINLKPYKPFTVFTISKVSFELIQIDTAQISGIQFKALVLTHTFISAN